MTVTDVCLRGDGMMDAVAGMGSEGLSGRAVAETLVFAAAGMGSWTGVCEKDDLAIIGTGVLGRGPEPSGVVVTDVGVEDGVVVAGFRIWEVALTDDSLVAGNGGCDAGITVRGRAAIFGTGDEVASVTDSMSVPELVSCGWGSDDGGLLSPVAEAVNFGPVIFVLSSLGTMA